MQLSYEIRVYLYLEYHALYYTHYFLHHINIYDLIISMYIVQDFVKFDWRPVKFLATLIWNVTSLLASFNDFYIIVS